ncbi:MAG: DUF5011 domain-containing protein [Bacteroidales bacterium]|nr:DUF5011 domain-containing protein [Bacteroidales bacterium]
MKRLTFIIIPIALLLLSACDKDDKDTNPPVITLEGVNPTIAGYGLDYVDAGATAYDEEDGDITDKIVVNNGVNTADTGTYYVRYNVEDNAGNTAQEVSRTVNVIYF